MWANPSDFCGLCGAPWPHDAEGQAVHDRRIAEIDRALDASEMCVTCCRRVPKTEIEAGLHKHPAVMD